MNNDYTRYFLIIYECPETKDTIELVKSFSGENKIAVTQEAEDYAYDLADKGSYHIEETKRPVSDVNDTKPISGSVKP